VGFTFPVTADLFDFRVFENAGVESDRFFCLAAFTV
jgi:hypothetical protein